jgi:cytidine deaminase
MECLSPVSLKDGMLVSDRTDKNAARDEQRHYWDLRQLLRRAHAPYSGFQVAARLLSEDGDVIDGCNVENASFGLGLCAERSALFRALSLGHRRFRMLYLLSSGSDPVSPCGACREALRQAAPELEIVMFGSSPDEVVRTSLTSLLPR